jgi:hypothetical protein
MISRRTTAPEQDIAGSRCSRLAWREAIDSSKDLLA